MSIILNKAIADWRQTDIEKLIKDKIAEGQSIEYKEKMYERNDESIREMLRDITAFANAYGGYLIIGIKEDDEDQGIPTEILGVENAEEERDRISSLCLSSIDPRIPGFEIQIVPSGKQNPIIILHIPRSLRMPHMVTFKGLFQFWKRHDRQKSKMNTDELKDGFSNF